MLEHIGVSKFETLAEMGLSAIWLHTLDLFGAPNG
jgi:hypothetical protein